MKLGIIGTNWISKSFVEAATSTGMYEFTAVYSRSGKSGQNFVDSCGRGCYYTNFPSFFNDEKIDVVYVASPNSIHFGQCKELIRHKKHIIVEKPAFSNLRELQLIHKMALKENVFVFEAARHIHEKNFRNLKNAIETIGTIRGASVSYMKYSSRYDAVLNGEEPNIFSLRYSGGALYDLGIYLVYAAIDLFGLPINYHYFPKKVVTGVDGIGQILFEYDNFNVLMNIGKICDSFAKTEIYGENGTIISDSIEYISSIVNSKNTDINLADRRREFNMCEEAEVFYKIIKNNDRESYNKLTSISASVHKILEDMRIDNNIFFEADLIQN